MTRRLRIYGIHGALLALCMAGMGCSKATTEAPPAAKPVKRMPLPMEAFFVDWLKGHGEKNVVVDDRGVGLAGNETRLWASTYGVNEKPGQGYTVEMEFRVTLPSGRQIVEFVAGLGDNEEAARKQSMANFIISTFHVIYKSFLNQDDPHQQVEPLVLDGKKRELYRGNMYLLSNGPLDAPVKEAINRRLQEFPSQLHLSAGPHWVKLVYSQVKGKALTVAVTVDNEDDAPLTRLVAGQAWPPAESVYMAKQFMIIK